MKIRMITILLCIPLAGMANFAQAQSCSAMFDDLLTFTQTNNNYVEFEMVAITSPLRWSQYSTGSLRYLPGSQNKKSFTRPSLQGDATQYFSDRRWAPPGQFAGVNPFDPTKTDKLHVGISSFSAAGPPQITFTLLSWGNSASSYTPTCGNGLMFGDMGTAGKYIFTFRKVPFSVPK